MQGKIFEYGVSDQQDAAALGQRGQGLFVAKTYMAKMGGTIVASNVEGGVCFELRLQYAGTAKRNAFSNASKWARYSLLAAPATTYSSDLKAQWCLQRALGRHPEPGFRWARSTEHWVHLTRDGHA